MVETWSNIEGPDQRHRNKNMRKTGKERQGKGEGKDTLRQAEEGGGGTGTWRVLPELLGTLGAEWGGFPRGRGSW